MILISVLRAQTHSHSMGHVFARFDLNIPVEEIKAINASVNFAHSDRQRRKTNIRQERRGSRRNIKKKIKTSKKNIWYVIYLQKDRYVSTHVGINKHCFSWILREQNTPTDQLLRCKSESGNRRPLWPGALPEPFTAPVSHHYQSFFCSFAAF